jgi:pseudolysin
MKNIFKLAALPIALATMPVWAAIPVDLSHQAVPQVRGIVAATQTILGSGSAIRELARQTDFNQTLHVRFQQTYQGYDVWGADAVLHTPGVKKIGQELLGTVTPATSMNGIVYKDLQADLTAPPADEQSKKALMAVAAAYQHQTKVPMTIKEQKSKLIVYVTPNNKAVWAYKISLFAVPVAGIGKPAKPVFIVDAVSSDKVYLSWDDVKTLDSVEAGGFGGNEKMGKLVYDGLSGHLPVLHITRDAMTAQCYLQNADVIVVRKNSVNTSGGTAMSFMCKTTDPTHHDLYWNGEHDAVNGAYSPANDALYAGGVIKQMYAEWFGLPVLKNQDGSAMRLEMAVHDTDPAMTENAYWDGSRMVFGDGGDTLFPLTSLGVAAHEISHGFTEQHAALVYTGQSGAMNEAYSDMAAKAAEYYSYGRDINWEIGSEIFRENGMALRYMDDPQKDCLADWMKSDRYAGLFCSVKTVQQFGWGLGIDVHYGSGIYNHVFYRLSNATNWNTRKAFQVMAQANAFYWTSYSTFAAGGCGVVKATNDFALAKGVKEYDVEAVHQAFAAVGINTRQCR